MISSTFLPSARNASAIAVARKAPRMRSTGEWLAGTATTTERLRASPNTLVSMKVGDFAAALADQADDDHVRLRRAHDHAEQHRLADARARHDADALALADRQEAVDRAHAHVERLAHAAAVERRWSACPRAAICVAPRIGPSPSIDLARAVDDSAEQRRADFGLAGRADRADRGVGQQRRGAAEVHQQVLPPRKPITSASIRPAPVPTAQTVPTGNDRPTASISSPSNDESRPETLALGAKSRQPSPSR